MAEQQIKQEVFAENVSPSADDLSVEAEPLDVSEGLESPARRLQHMLGAELNDQFGEDVISGKWSVRRSVAFIAVTSCLFWFTMWLGLRAIF
ncbi:MAG: hypothetical protein ACWA5L_02990 [bacterium]